MSRLPAATPIEKAFSLPSMPGRSYGNVQLENAHGNGVERLEGLGTYNVQWGQPLNNVGYTAPCQTCPAAGTIYQDRPAALTRLTGGLNPLFQSNDYRATLPAALVGGYTGGSDPYGAVFGPRGKYLRAQPAPPNQSDNSTWANQSASSQHRLDRRYMGDGYDPMHDLRSDAGGTAYMNPAYADYGHGLVAQMREADAVLDTQMLWDQRAQAAALGYPGGNFARGGGGQYPMPYASMPPRPSVFRLPNDNETPPRVLFEGASATAAKVKKSKKRKSFKLRISNEMLLIGGIIIGVLLILAVKGLVSLF